MKKQSWIRDLICLAGLMALAFSGTYIMQAFQEMWERTMELSAYSLFAVKCAPFFLAGLLLGLMGLLKERKKPGVWKTDWAKLGLLWIPTLYFGLSLFIYYSNFLCTYLPALQVPAGLLLRGETEYLGIFQMASGYFFLTAFYKTTGDGEAADGAINH